MVVKRVAELNIRGRNFITAICGCTEDSFVDSDLCSYSFKEQLFLYLKNEGYERIYYYDRDKILYSFDRASLSALNENTAKPREKSNEKGRVFFQLIVQTDKALIDYIKEILACSTNKTVIYIDAASFDLSDVDKPRFIDGIKNAMEDAASSQSENKLLYRRDCEGVFKSNFFVELLKDQDNIFTIGLPDKEECGNWLHSKRIKNETEEKTVIGFQYNILIDQILNKYKRIIDMDTEYRIDSKSFWKAESRVATFNKEQLIKDLDSVKGQQDNIEVIVNAIYTWIRKKKKTKPLVLMFAGTSGTGKTYTAKRIQKALAENGYGFVRINMNEYSSPGDNWKFLGSPTGHVGSETDAPIFAARKDNDKLVILFDEIDKAHASLFNTLMSLMDEGMLNDGKGISYDFRQSIIVFTSNLAMNELVETKKSLSGVRIDSEEFQKATKSVLAENKMPPYILRRIKWLLVYNTLSVSDVERIALEQIREMGKEIYDLNINKVSEKYLNSIAAQCADSMEGASPIEGEIESTIEPILQDAYESNKYSVDAQYDINDNLQLVESFEDNNL